MPIHTNKMSKKQLKKHSLLAGAFLFLLVLGAKVDLDFGGVVSFTLQTLVLGLSYYLLPRSFRVGLIGVYLLLGIVGVPVFNGDAGWVYFSSWPLGFFVGFVVAAFIPVAVPKGFSSALQFFSQLHVVILVLGAVWVGIYGSSSTKGIETLVELLPGALIKSFAGAGIVWLLYKIK